MNIKSVASLNFCEETIQKKHILEIGWIELCGRLKEIRDKELFKGRWESFEDFLNDPAMDLDKSSASKMITIQEKLILEYKIKPDVIASAGGWSKVAECLPAIVDKESAEEWLEKSSYLSKSDLRKEIQEKNREGIGCRHNNTYRVVMCCCKDCNNKEIEKYLNE